MDANRQAQQNPGGGFNYARLYQEAQAGGYWQSSTASADEPIDGIPTEEWATYLGPSSPSYLRDFSQMQNQMIRMEICGKIDAGLQIFHQSFPGVSRPGKTGGIAMMLIGLHSPRFQFPADPPGFRVEIEAVRFFEVIAGNHDFGHSGFAHAVDVVTDFRIAFFDELFSIPDDAFHAV